MAAIAASRVSKTRALSLRSRITKETILLSYKSKMALRYTLCFLWPGNHMLINFHIHMAALTSMPVLFTAPFFLILLGYLFSFFTFTLAVPLSFNASSYCVKNSFSRKDSPAPLCFFWSRCPYNCFCNFFVTAEKGETA